MFNMPGGFELIIILLIVLVIFGAGKLPSVGGALGKGIRNFKKGIKDVDEEDDPEQIEKKDDEDGK